MNHHDTPHPAKLPAATEPGADPAPPTTVLVVGTGAVGGYYGDALARAGALVSTVHRADFDTVRQHGIRIDSIDGDRLFTPHRVLRDVRECPEPPDYLLVCLKALPEIRVEELIRPAVGPRTAIILLQNGIGVEEPIARAFPHNELISALAFICVQRVAPGRIRHLCYGRITFGLYPQGAPESVQRLARLFETAAIPCKITASPVTARWGKLLWNASYNPISVLAGNVTTQEIMDSPECVDLVRHVMREVAEIARAEGHPLPETAIEDNLRATRQMKPYHTSMALDFMAGRPLESEVILGAAIRAGRRHGVPGPCLEGLYGMIRLLEGAKREKIG